VFSRSRLLQLTEAMKGKLVVVYPEGTLTRDPELWPMVGKTGAARIALVEARYYWASAQQTACPASSRVLWRAVC